MTSLHSNESHEVIWLRRDAPQKPNWGDACNGCGVCCAASPCPVARVFLSITAGACPALKWDDSGQRYRCGLLASPKQYLPALPRLFIPFFQRYVRRSISAGSGCDSLAELQMPSENET